MRVATSINCSFRCGALSLGMLVFISDHGSGINLSPCCQSDAHRQNSGMFKWMASLLGGNNSHDPLGQRSENVAARFLRNHGYKIIHRNFRCDVGELDIVAKDGKTLVFVEVKTRADDDPTPETQ